jgi:PKD repeat protein
MKIFHGRNLGKVAFLSLGAILLSLCAGLSDCYSCGGSNCSVAETTCEQQAAATQQAADNEASISLDNCTVGADACTATYNQSVLLAEDTYNSSRAACEAVYNKCAAVCITITATAGPNGSVSGPNGYIAPPGIVTGIEPGSTYNITMNPYYCYHVSSIFVDNNIVGTNIFNTTPPTSIGYSFSNLTTDHTLASYYAINTYTITSSAGTGGSITPSEAGISCGNSRVYTLTANTGFHITSLLVDGSPASMPNSPVYGQATYPYTFGSIIKSYTIAGTFSDKYPIYATLAGTGKGTVTTNPSSFTCTTGVCTAQFQQGSSVTLTAAPDSDSTFDGWSGDCSGTNPACTVTMNYDKSPTSTFKILPPAAQFSVSFGGSGSPVQVNFVNQSLRGWDSSRGTTTYPAYSDAYTWDFGDGIKSNDKNPTHKYKVVGTYTITLTVKNPTGSASISSNITVNPCGNLPVRVVPAVGSPRYFASLGEAYSSAADGDSIQALALNFKEDVNSSKSVNFSGGFDCDFNNQMDVTTLLGAVNITDSQASIGSFSLLTDSTAASYYQIAAYSTTGGNISPAGTMTVLQGANFTFHITPNPGAYVLDILVDGVSVGPLTQYNFTGIAGNHSIKAVFARTLTVTTAGEGGGTITSTPGAISCGSICTAQLQDGTVVTLSAAPDAFSKFTGWSGGGCSGAGTCTINLNADTTVTASFSTSHARVVGAIPSDFDTVQAAYNAAASGATILLRNLTMTENVSANAIKTVTVKGGYDVTYTTQAGLTTLIGAVSTIAGSANISNVNVLK